jgi:hypothetical protein
MKQIYFSASILLILFILIVGKTQIEQAPLIAEFRDGEYKIVLSNETIEKFINLSPFNFQLQIKSTEIIELKNRKYLKIIGHENSKCLIALKKIQNNLHELSSLEIPIVICSGCEDGCSPEREKDGWFCSNPSKPCEECEKSVTASDDYIFE